MRRPHAFRERAPHHSICRPCHLRRSAGSRCGSARRATPCAGARPRRSGAPSRAGCAPRSCPAVRRCADARRGARGTSRRPRAVRSMPACSHIVARIASAATCAAPRSASGGTSQLPRRRGCARSRGVVDRGRAPRARRTRAPRAASSTRGGSRRARRCAPPRRTRTAAAGSSARARSVTIAAHHVVRGRRDRDEVASRGSMPRARQSARCPGKRSANGAASRRACARRGRRAPCFCCSRKISRATMSRGASSASRCALRHEPLAARVHERSRPRRAPPRR